MRNLKKTLYILLFVFLLCGCGKSVDSSASAALPPEETVQSLFEEAAGIIRNFVTEDPRDALDMDFNGTAIIKAADGAYDFSEQKTINGCPYCKTALTYQQAVDHYSEIFTGEALNSFMPRYFYDDGGALYVNGVGGMSGFGIDHIEITYMSQSDGEYFYQAAYNHVMGFEETELSPSECNFSVKKVDGEYRISTIDYLSAFLADYPYTD